MPTPETHECLFQVNESLTGPCMVCGITAEQAIKEAASALQAREQEIGRLNAIVGVVSGKERDGLLAVGQKLIEQEALVSLLSEALEKCRCWCSCEYGYVFNKHIEPLPGFEKYPDHQTDCQGFIITQALSSPALQPALERRRAEQAIVEKAVDFVRLDGRYDPPARYQELKEVVLKWQALDAQGKEKAGG